MKTVSKKLFSLLLVAIMLVSAIPMLAYAEVTHIADGSDGHTVTWAVDETDATKHTSKCAVEDCDYVPVTEQHTYSEGECTKCHYKHTNHTFGAVVVDTAATCTATGTGHKTCEVCGFEERVEISKISHTEEEVDEVPATCTTDGTEAGTKCSVCDTILSGCETITHLGHSLETNPDDPKVDATCTEAGHEAGKRCARPGCTYTEAGAAISATGHKFSDSSSTCTNAGCDEPKANHYFAVTFVVKDPFASSTTNTSVEDKYYDGQTVRKVVGVSSPSFSDCDFDGWYLDNGTWEKPFIGSKIVGDTTVYAKISPKQVTLEVYYKLGSKTAVRYGTPVKMDLAEAKDTRALKYLDQNITDDFADYIAKEYPGYEWEDQDWYDYDNKSIGKLIQDQTLDESRAVLAKLTARKYEITFDLNAGGDKSAKLLTTNVKNYKNGVMTVTFNESVGTLPTAQRTGYVFKGWNTRADGTGTEIEDKDIYDIAGDVTLYAQWDDQVLVNIYVYLNNKTTYDGPQGLTGFKDGDTLTLKDVTNRLKKNYSFSAIDGIFTADTWQEFVDSKYKNKGQTDIIVESNQKGEFNIYVRLRNASVDTSKWDTSNPKTGDSAMIYTAGVVLVLAACGLGAAAYFTRKKKQA